MVIRLRKVIEAALGRRATNAIAGMKHPFVTMEGLPDWEVLLGTNRPLWEQAAQTAANGPKVLIATNVGGHGPVSVVESMLGVALTLRGVQVHTLLCDGMLPGCLKAEISSLPDPGVIERYELPKVLCPGCVQRGEAVFSPIGTKVIRLSELVTPQDLDQAKHLAAETPATQIPHFRQDGLAVGEHAYAGALRYYARGDLSAESLGEVVLRRYFEASLLTAYAMQRLLKEVHFTAACFHHGLYVPQGIVGEACRKCGVRLSNWVVAYRRNTLIFSHGDTYHHTLLSEPATEWEGMAWGDQQDAQILDYLKSRWRGTRDWIWFHEKPDEDFDRFIRVSGIEPGKPCVAMLTNVMWDAQLHYRANAFSNMLDWVLQTIGYFKRRPDVQLLIRIHPAEIRGTAKSRQPLTEEIEKFFPQLPRNVFIIPPESPVSTYAAMMHCDSAIIYGTKTGVELTSIGIPVIVAGEAWIRNKGITLDASSPEQYFEILDRLPLGRRNSIEITRRARKYAYHFFFRRMIPLPFLVPNGGPTAFQIAIEKLDNLLPGNYPGLDVICNGILGGTPYIYPAETYGIHDGFN